MTGHRPDQPGMQNPSDSASQNAGADVSADEFAAALKLIVTRLEGQEDSAESPPQGRDVEDAPTAVPPTGVLNSAPDAQREDALWTGLADSMPADPAPVEPEAPSPLAGSLDSSTASSDVTTAADLWPASSPAPETQPLEPPPPESPPPESPSEPTAASDPLFTETPAARSEPAAEPALQQPVAEDPLFGEPSGGLGSESSDTPRFPDRAATCRSAKRPSRRRQRTRCSLRATSSPAPATC